MDNSVIAQIKDIASSDPEFFRDTLRLAGILYKYHAKHSPIIDIIPCSLTPYVMI